MLLNYIKVAFRNFMRHKLLTLINITGLSIGITASMVIFLIVKHDFSFDQFHKDKDKIYRVVTDFSYSGEQFYSSGVPGPLADAVKKEATGISESTPVLTKSYDVTIPGTNIVKLKNEDDIAYTDQGYFNIFAYKWLAGSAASMVQPYQVVLSAKQAKKYFPLLSYQQMLGKTVTYDDSIRTAVSGIVEDFKDNTDLTFHDFISYATVKKLHSLKAQQAAWDSTDGASLLFVKLANATIVRNTENQLQQLLHKYQPDAKKSAYKSNFRLQPLSDIHFNENYYSINSPTANKTALYGLMLIAVFLLLLACINFINLTTAQSSQRAKEIGIRKTMGSSRLLLVGQFLSETFIITLLAVVISIALVPVILKVFSDFISKGVTLNLLHNPGILVFSLILVIVVSFVSGFYPALVLSRYQPIAVLKNQVTGASNSRNAWLRKSLTVSQFVIAQFFIMATLLVSKQIYYVLHKDLGFKKDAIVYVRAPWKQRDGLKQVFIDKIKNLPQISMVSLSDDVPSSTGWTSNDVSYRDGKKEIRSELYHKTADENYMKLYHIKLLAGRNVGIEDTATKMLVNSAYAHILGFKNLNDAIGKIIYFGSLNKREIVGVIGDFHQASLKAAIKPMALLPAKLLAENTLSIALKPNVAGSQQWTDALSAMRKEWKAVYPDDDFNYHFFDESIAKMYDKEQRTSQLLNWAAGLSVLISCLGLIGLAIFTTSQRTKEIGVRKVLGASVSQIVTLLSTELVFLVVLSFVIVCPLAWLSMHKWIQSFADRTEISWWIFAEAGAGILLTALLTLSFQTIRAALANPVKSLRSE